MKVKKKLQLARTLLQKDYCMLQRPKKFGKVTSRVCRV